MEGFTAKQCLLMLGKWKSAIDSEKTFDALLTGLQNAFEYLSHDLLTAKLNAYGFSIAALRLVQNYLSIILQRIKINFDFCSWEEILLEISQGSIIARRSGKK